MDAACFVVGELFKDIIGGGCYIILNVVNLSKQEN